MVGFHADCMRTCVRPEIAVLTDADHPMAGLLCHLRHSCDPVSTTTAMMNVNLRQARQYSYHGSALCDADFVWAELAAQTTMGHIVVIPWVDVRWMLGIWISTLSIIPQEVHQPQLIYEYTWSNLNVAVILKLPREGKKLRSREMIAEMKR